MKTKIAINALFASIVLVSCIPAIKTTSTETAIATLTILASATTISTTVLPVKEVLFDVALSSDGTKLAAYTNMGVYIYDTGTLSKTVFREFDNPDFGVNKAEILPGAVAFSSDGKTIALSGKFADTYVELWDISTGKNIMAIGDIPNGYSVNQIRFSPDNRSIFIRSFYPWSMRCEQVEANLALHKIDLQKISHTKLFEKDYCQYIPVGTIQFTNDGKMFIFARSMAEQYWVSLVDIAATPISQETEYEYKNGEFYDVSSDGKIYAIMHTWNNSRFTELIDAETSKVLRIIPYKVKLLADKDRFLVRDFFSLSSEWGLWENESIVCNFDGLVDTSFDWELSENGKMFITTTSDDDIIIWNVSDCSVRNVLHFSK